MRFFVIESGTHSEGFTYWTGDLFSARVAHDHDSKIFHSRRSAESEAVFIAGKWPNLIGKVRVTEIDGELLCSCKRNADP